MSPVCRLGRQNHGLACKSLTLGAGAEFWHPTGELGYRAAHGRFTSHLADLVAGDKKLAGDLAVGLVVELDVGSNGNSYLVQSSVLSLVRARTGSRITADSCQVVKEGSGVDCSPLAA